MKLIRLTLSNYCQYGRLTIEFDEGVTILRGRNGRGKSNFINAIFFALTGDSCIKNKTRTSMLKWGEDRGYVELVFSMHGSSYTVKRMLNSSSVILKGDSLAEDITKSREASEFVADLIKADADVLKISSFMPQVGASELVFGTKTERQKAFSRLFKLLHLESNRAELQKEYSKIPVYTDVSDIIAQLSGDIATLEIGIKTLNEDNTADYIKDNKDKYQRMYDSRDKKYTESEYRKVRDELVNKTVIEKALLEGLISELEELDEPVMLSPEDAELYREYKEFEKLCSDMLAAKEKADNPRVIADPATQEDVDLANSKLTDANNKMRDVSKKLKLWESGKCGECGTSFKHTEAEIEVLRREVEEANEECARSAESLRQLKSRLEDTKEAERENKAEAAVFEDLQREVLDGAGRWESYDPEEYIEKQKKSLESQGIIGKRAKINERIKESSDKLAKANQELVVLDAEGFKPDDFSDEFMTSYVEAMARQQEMEKQRASVTTALNIKKEQLIERKKEQRLADMSTKHRKFISDLRTVLHVDNYPRLAVALKKGNLSIILNKYLAIFEQPFTVNINDSLEFVCAFSDNPTVGADELSGGQKAMLLVSVRLAIAEMLAHDVELLTFDEPGAAMDKEAKQGLLEAFDTVRKYLSGQRVQMLVASHDDNIEGIADSIVQL